MFPLAFGFSEHNWIKPLFDTYPGRPDLSVPLRYKSVPVVAAFLDVFRFTR